MKDTTPAAQVRLKYIATINDEALGEDTAPDCEIQYVDISNVDSSGGIGEIVSYRFEDAPSRARRRVRDGDVIISTVRTYLQAIAQIRQPPENLIASTGFAVVRPRPERLAANYCKYALREPTFLAEVEMRSVGVSYPAINASDFASIPVHVHPLSQQHAIGDYLDRETARIDALIAAKERLIALLAEKRRALITRAVTRGLNPSVPFRDSGIPWLGEIPAHWETVALRFLVESISGATPDTGSSEFWDGEIPWVSPKDMKRLEIDDAQDHVSELALSTRALHLIAPGSVLIVVRGMILSHSFPTAVTTAVVTINQDMKALRCHESLDPYFLRDFFRGSEEYIVSLADASAHGTRKLETEVLGRLQIALPPFQEQRAIAAHIGETTAMINELEAAARATTSLLRERRAALISAAVTGQIDVETAA
ncbi:MAG: restriction endonuclease subunit S [Phycisphaerales bacterium]